MAPPVSCMSCSGGSLQREVNVIGLLQLESKQTGWQRLPCPNLGAVPFSRARSPNGTWLPSMPGLPLRLHVSGGPFLSPFSIPNECLGSQQRVTPALVLWEKD